jgi:hypothetical protein
MKYNFFILSLLTSNLLIISVGCERETLSRSISSSIYPPPPPPPPNQAIYANANMSITIELPMNFGILNGEAYGPGRNGASYKWEKVSGPASYFLENPDSLKTKVRNLEKGVYQFQLTVTTNAGQTSTDIMTLKVQDASSSNKQIFFWDLNWSCPFGCSILLGDISSYVPANSTYAINIRRESSSIWELVVPDSTSSTARYIYSIWNGQLTVFDNSYIDATDHPEIKIAF